MPDFVERGAKAKVNLALHVLGRRADLYHDIDTLAVFADVADRVAVSPAAELTLSLFGPFADHAPAGPANLAYKAADLLRQRTGHVGGAAIRLEKNIPAGAGLGGGSGDAAATLLALNELWGLSLDRPALAGLAQTLGADVPMCLASAALRARGLGDRVEPISGWPEMPLALVWPGVRLATAEIFAALETRENAPLPDPPPPRDVAECAAWLAACRNDLEATARKRMPEIAAALEELGKAAGCLLARMSGSGSGCFGIFSSPGEAEAAARAISAARPGWWVRATTAR